MKQYCIYIPEYFSDTFGYHQKELCVLLRRN